MADDTMTALYDTVARDPDLQARFLAARDLDGLRAAVTAAGFDPDAPEIVAALGLEEALDEADLETTAGGYMGRIDRSGLPSMFGTPTATSIYSSGPSNNW